MLKSDLPALSRSTGAKLTRRQFLQAGVSVAGGLLLTVTLPPARVFSATDVDTSMVTAWLRIAPDGAITVMIPSAEMGQGITTSLSMLIAEELEADWSQIRTAFAPAAEAYVNPNIYMQATFGSNSIRGFYEPLRRAGATAREMLRAAAAQRWDVPVAECTATNGRITHSSGRSEQYGALAEAAARLPVPTDVALKPASAWRLIGKATPRLDTQSKVDGSAEYGIDVELSGLLIATIAACPVFGGTLQSVNEASALAVKGVKTVVRLEDAVAVVADGYWPARKGLLALDPVWDEAQHADLDTTRIAALLEEGLAAEGAVAENSGDVEAALAAAKHTIEAVYALPLLAHAPMEPMNATAVVTDKSCTVWAPTQNPTRAQHVAAELLGLSPDQVTIQPTFLGGGFGRRAEQDFIIQAVQVARQAGAPVKLIWSREEDIQHDFYRPAAMAHLRAGVDPEGKLMGLHAKLVSPSLMARVYPPAVENGVDPTSVEGLVASPYEVNDRRIEYVLKDVGVPTGFWRSVGNSITAFIVEVFMDEAAHAAGRDPVDFRLELLAGKPRHRAVIETAARMAGWGQALPDGHFRGLAMHHSMGSIVAEVVEIALDGVRLRVHRVDCAIDCGVAINPNTIVAQMESSIVYGLNAALVGEITLGRGRVEQTNFDTYPVLKLAHMPEVNVSILEGDEQPGGVGEPGTPPVAPALVNAIFAATGRRARSLPVSKHGFVTDL